MNFFKPKDGETYILQNYVGEINTKYGTKHHYQFIDNGELKDHLATKIEHLSGMRAGDKKGTALSTMKENQKVKVELVSGKYPARIWSAI